MLCKYFGIVYFLFVSVVVLLICLELLLWCVINSFFVNCDRYKRKFVFKGWLILLLLRVNYSRKDI